jgi:hypothetical protein
MRFALPVQRALASFVLTLYVAFTAFGGALVRCHEVDGTVTIEWRAAGCCDPCGDEAACDASDCEGCEDEALTEGLSSFAGRKLASLDDADAAPPAPFVALPATRLVAPVGRAPLFAPTRPPPLAALRTVVLRV